MPKKKKERSREKLIKPLKKSPLKEEQLKSSPIKSNEYPKNLSDKTSEHEIDINSHCQTHYDPHYYHNFYYNHLQTNQYGNYLKMLKQQNLKITIK